MTCDIGEIFRVTIILYQVLAHCYVVAKVYKVLYNICDTVPPCGARVHNYIVISSYLCDQNSQNNVNWCLKF